MLFSLLKKIRTGQHRPPRRRRTRTHTHTIRRQTTPDFSVLSPERFTGVWLPLPVAPSALVMRFSRVTSTHGLRPMGTPEKFYFFGKPSGFFPRASSVMIRLCLYHSIRTNFCQGLSALPGPPRGRALIPGPPSPAALSPAWAGIPGESLQFGLFSPAGVWYTDLDYGYYMFTGRGAWLASPGRDITTERCLYL